MNHVTSIMLHNLKQRLFDLNDHLNDEVVMWQKAITIELEDRGHAAYSDIGFCSKCIERKKKAL